MGIAPMMSAIYSWLLMTGGFVVSILLARTLRSRGFYLVAVFFLSPVFAWGLREVQYRIHREAIDAYAAEQNRMIQSGEIVAHINSTVRFPLFESLLVIGLFMVLRRLNQPPQCNAGSPPSSDDPPASESPSSLGPLG